MIIVSRKDRENEYYKFLTTACSEHNKLVGFSEFSHGYLTTKKFPFKYKGYKFEKKEVIK